MSANPTGPERGPLFREQGMTYRALVRDAVQDPNLTDAQCDHLLWEHTPFPCVRGRDELLPHLIVIRDDPVRRPTQEWAQPDKATAEDVAS